MVLTNAQITAFFTANNQMALPTTTYAQLAVEGIQTVDDLADFDKDSLDQVANNLRRPAGGAAAFTFGAKLHKRLLASTKLIKYYETVGRTLTAANILWKNMGKNFELQ